VSRRPAFAPRLTALFAVVLTLVAALPATALVAGLPTTALADGDPASDVLLGENVFYPYSPAVSPSVQKSLNATTAAAKRAGFPIKVALIASPVDLGVIPDLFGKPQKYAAFLDQEISFRGKQPLLVVMPAGYGVQGLSPKATSMVATLPKPTSGQGNALATAAESAVMKLADASGRPISGASQNGSSSSSSGGGGSSSTLVIILAVAAVIAAGALAAITLRRRRAGPASR
jgi:MYXO-CTERM domain-containing protein